MKIYLGIKKFKSFQKLKKKLKTEKHIKRKK